MAELTVQDITSSGLNPSLSAAEAGGDTFTQVEPDVFLYADNADASAKQITVTAENTAKTVSDWGTLTATDIVVSVPAGESRFIGPFPRGPYSLTPAITYDDVTSLTVAAVRLPR